MTVSLIGACGLDCGICPGYQATQANDQTAIEKIASEWRLEFNSPEIKEEDVLCDGCMTKGMHVGGYCRVCEIRACVNERQLENCAFCADYACDRLTAFLEKAPPAKTNLEKIRLTLV